MFTAYLQWWDHHAWLVAVIAVPLIGLLLVERAFRGRR